MKTLNYLIGICITLLTFNALNAQVYWVGGTPGTETKWEEPKNWSNHKVPTAFDEVVIPDCSSKGGFYPEIKTEVEAIAHLTIQDNASVNLHPEGTLTIDGSSTFNTGITLVGRLNNEGQINIFAPGLKAVEILRPQQSVGSIALINAETDTLVKK